MEYSYYSYGAVAAADGVVVVADDGSVVVVAVWFDRCLCFVYGDVGCAALPGVAPAIV